MNKWSLKKIYDELKNKGATDSQTTEVIRKAYLRDSIEVEDMGADILVNKVQTELYVEDTDNINPYVLATSRMYATVLILNFIIEDNNEKLIEIINKNKNEERGN